MTSSDYEVIKALRSDPFWMLFACVLRRATTVENVHTLVERFVAHAPTAEEVAILDPRAVLDILGGPGVLRGQRKPSLLPKFAKQFLARPPKKAEDVTLYVECRHLAQDAFALWVEDRPEYAPAHEGLRRHLGLYSTTGSGILPAYHGEHLELFWYWMREREQIRRRRFLQGSPCPWTTDPILARYRFTNVYREQDKTTLWMRKHLTQPNDLVRNGPDMIFNCALFRLFGTIRAGELFGWQTHWVPRAVWKAAEAFRKKGEKLFTSAYIVTNVTPGMDSSLPKAQVVCEGMLTPLWKMRAAIYACARETRSLEKTFDLLQTVPGFGGGGFIAYEVISDLRWTHVLNDATDTMAWANPGPGCKRGLNWVHGRGRTETWKRQQAIESMQQLLALAPAATKLPALEMREIEHSLCEYDKYMRTRTGLSRPRGTFA